MGALTNYLDNLGPRNNQMGPPAPTTSTPTTPVNTQPLDVTNPFGGEPANPFMLSYTGPGYQKSGLDALNTSSSNFVGPQLPTTSSIPSAISLQREPVGGYSDPTYTTPTPTVTQSDLNNQPTTSGGLPSVTPTITASGNTLAPTTASGAIKFDESSPTFVGPKVTDNAGYVDSGLPVPTTTTTDPKTGQTTTTITPQAQTIKDIYKAELGREPDAEGWAYYTQALESGSLTPYEIARQISISPEGKTFDSTGYINYSGESPTYKHAGTGGQAGWTNGIPNISVSAANNVFDKLGTDYISGNAANKLDNSQGWDTGSLSAIQARGAGALGIQRIAETDEWGQPTGRYTYSGANINAIAKQAGIDTTKYKDTYKTVENVDPETGQTYTTQVLDQTAEDQIYKAINTEGKINGVPVSDIMYVVGRTTGPKNADGSEPNAFADDANVTGNHAAVTYIKQGGVYVPIGEPTYFNASTDLSPGGSFFGDIISGFGSMISDLGPIGQIGAAIALNAMLPGAGALGSTLTGAAATSATAVAAGTLATGAITGATLAAINGGDVFKGALNGATTAGVTAGVSAGANEIFSTAGIDVNAISKATNGALTADQVSKALTSALSSGIIAVGRNGDFTQSFVDTLVASGVGSATANQVKDQLAGTLDDATIKKIANASNTIATAGTNAIMGDKNVSQALEAAVINAVGTAAGNEIKTAVKGDTTTPTSSFDPNRPSGPLVDSGTGTTVADNIDYSQGDVNLDKLNTASVAWTPSSRAELDNLIASNDPDWKNKFNTIFSAEAAKPNSNLVFNEQDGTYTDKQSNVVWSWNPENGIWEGVNGSTGEALTPWSAANKGATETDSLIDKFGGLVGLGTDSKTSDIISAIGGASGTQEMAGAVAFDTQEQKDKALDFVDAIIQDPNATVEDKIKAEQLRAKINGTSVSTSGGGGGGGSDAAPLGADENESISSVYAGTGTGTTTSGTGTGTGVGTGPGVQIGTGTGTGGGTGSGTGTGTGSGTGDGSGDGDGFGIDTGTGTKPGTTTPGTTTGTGTGGYSIRLPNLMPTGLYGALVSPILGGGGPLSSRLPSALAAFKGEDVYSPSSTEANDRRYAASDAEEVPEYDPITGVLRMKKKSSGLEVLNAATGGSTNAYDAFPQSQSQQLILDPVYSDTIYSKSTQKIPTASPLEAFKYAEGGEVEGHNPQFYSEGGVSMANRYVKGDGDGTSDSVPAMLATGEFVIPADVVSSLGNGDNDSGATILDEFLRTIREHKRAADAKHLPPDSKGPLAYLMQANKKVRK